MKTIAITVDEPTLKGIVKVAARGRGGRRMSRSEVVRIALHEFLDRWNAREREETERQILAKHRAKLEKQLDAAVKEQARP